MIRPNPVAVKTMLLALALILMSACAAQPRPEEICTAEWIKPRVDTALTGFRENTGEIMESLGDVGSIVVGSGGVLGMLDKVRVMLKLTKLVSNFEGGQTFKDLNTLGRTCNDPELAVNALKGVLTEYKVPEPIMDLLENLDEFKALAEEAASSLQ